MPTLLGLPYDLSSSFQRGAAGGPAAIRRALRSDSTNLWTEPLHDLGLTGALDDAGDVRFTGPAQARQEITSDVARLLAAGRQPVLLGGDHSITYPALRAFHAVLPRLTVLHFDAHPDLYDEFQGDRYSHACPFARIMEDGLATRLVQIGIRAMTGHQREQAERFGVEVYGMADWREDWTPTVEEPVYLSIDLDVLDPAFAPGVSHPEPGGLSTRQLLRLIQAIDAPVVGADIVELNPENDPAGLTARAAAKILKEVAGKMR